MLRGFGEEILDDAFGQFAGTLILFQNNEYRHVGFDVCAGLPVYGVHGLRSFRKTVKSRSFGDESKYVSNTAASLRCWVT
jgi:hypothetical protein